MSSQPSSDSDVRSKNTNQLLLSFLLASGIPVFSGAAYLTGVSYHYAYLASFAIPEKLISKTTSDMFIYAYTAISEMGVRLMSIAGILLVLWVVAAVYLWQILNSIDVRVQRSSSWFRWRQRLSGKPGVKFLGKLVFVPIFVSALSYIVVALFIVFLLPKMIGQQAGLQRARDDTAFFKKGCSKTVAKGYSCVNVFEDKLLVSSGFVIDSSESYIAIYENAAVRTLPVTNKYFVANHPVLDK